jgi:hypothetical protein
VTREQVLDWLRRLHEKTLAGQVTWRRVEISPAMKRDRRGLTPELLVVDLTSNARLELSFESPPAAPDRVTVVVELGKKVNREFVYEDSSPGFEEAKTTWDAALGSLYGIDEELKAINEALESDAPLGQPELQTTS